LYTLKSESDIGRIRKEISDQCFHAAKKACGIYKLNVPTGGGKTLASVLWGLHHAIENHLQRIIIAIPYTSIIVQTAATLKSIFGEENVLEHHSNVDYNEKVENVSSLRLHLATENWDYPIIVTTNVQLFESLFSNKRSRCRKLHNLVNSVVILDEVQTLPLAFYKPIVHTLETLHRLFGASILLTTASQPVLSGHIEGANPFVGFDALPSVREIVPAEARLNERLRRVDLEFIDGACSYEEIANELKKHQRVLCVVNTRKDAKELFDRLPKEGVCLHLSRMMCPAHVAATIQKIKDTLKIDGNMPIRVVSTQLIEAGGDIDFPVVYRQEAGLDSILQSAGRCNREGKLGICTTYVFSLGKEHPLPPGLISQSNNARLNMRVHNDWFTNETMAEFFQQLHSRTDNFDKKQMEQMLYKQECEFEEAASHFRLIDDQTTTVLINWDGSMDLYKQLLSEGPSYSLMKKMAQYSVGVRRRDFNELQRIGAIEEPYENVYVITNPSFYKRDTGMVIENKWLEETYII